MFSLNEIKAITQAIQDCEKTREVYIKAQISDIPDTKKLELMLRWIEQYDSLIELLGKTNWWSADNIALRTNNYQELSPRQAVKTFFLDERRS